MTRRTAGLLLWAAASALAQPSQNAMTPAGRQAAQTHALLWLQVIVCGAVFVAVIGFVLYVILRWRGTPAGAGFEQSVQHASEGETRTMLRWVVVATGITIIILFVFLVASVFTGRHLSAYSQEQAFTVELTGHQWWWEVRYPNSDPSQIVVTANEIHIPVGKPVMIRGTSTDVIHSFWVPTLNGKRDLIPSRITVEYIEADHPGIFRGQCAEFCGLQHAHMSLMVIAEPAEQFNAWMAAQRLPAPEPTTDAERRGKDVFEHAPCTNCHAIRGADAFGQVAPDLTHVGGRRTIAAGTLPNTPGHLAAWIADSQVYKPGNKMPPIVLDAQDVQPVMAYLESLK
jgi:cytochrome c oxidase subunit 2